MIRCANKKFRNKAATSRSCLKSLLKISRGNDNHAMVSVTAVKIQLSSPNGVRLSFKSPGIRITICTVILDLGSRAVSTFRFNGSCSTKYRKAISIGEVKQQVKTSAGRSGVIGKI